MNSCTKPLLAHLRLAAALLGYPAVLSIVVLLAMLSSATFAQSNQPVTAVFGEAPLYKDPHADVEARVKDLLGRMSIEDKALLLHPNFFSTKPNPRLGIPPVRFIDGSYGVRSGRATSFCTLVNHAATWDPELINRVGVALAEEVKSKGRNMLLGPVIQMHRIPQAGRNAESYSEDPYLAGTMVSSYIKGIQSQKVAATAAFLGAKAQEYHTSFYDARVDERTLNEIYFPAFRRAVEDGHVWGLMTPYNRVNGVYAPNNPYLLWDMLKGKWKFQGVVMTDWAGAQNFKESVYAGLDLDTHSGRLYTVEKLTEIYKSAAKNRAGKGKSDFLVGEDMNEDDLLAGRLDESVRRVLRVMFANSMFEPEPVKAGFDTNAHRALSLKVARESITLLKNEGRMLPLDRTKIKSLAVIGPNANVCRHSIQHASRVLPYVEVTPLEGIQSKLGKQVEVRYSQGCDIEDMGRFLTDEHVVPASDRKGFLVEFFDNDDLQGKPAFTTLEHSIGYNWLANPVHPETDDGERSGGKWVPPLAYSVRVSGVWSPPQSGYYHLLATGTITANSQSGGNTNRGSGTPEAKTCLGRQYRYYEKDGIYAFVAEFRHDIWGDFQVRYAYHEEDALRHAVEAARQSEAAVLFLGFSEVLEREGRDRSPDLPENQLELLRAVSAVNSNVVVVLNTGSGVSIEPWGTLAPAIVEAYYPGQEGGTAIADILFGDANPAGKLPFTCMKQWKDSPVYGYYPNGPDEMAHYVEGIYVGYRWFDRPDAKAPAFPFGHGLSYTTFDYSDLTISPETTRNGEVTVTVKVRNTGQVAGAEAAQLYIGDDHASVDRPVKELKGYKKVFLQPGETTTARFAIHRDDLAFYDVRQHEWQAEPGSFTVFIGSSSRDIRQIGKFKLVDNTAP